MAGVQTTPLSWKMKASEYPFVAKTTFGLTLDNPGESDHEVFWGIQVVYTGEAPPASPPLVLVLSGDSNGTVNPVYAGLNGGVYGVAGIGIVSAGTDKHGTLWTADPDTRVIAFAGNASEGVAASTYS